MLITMIVGLAAPIEVSAYTESMFELAVASCPPIVWQWQGYTTSTRQTLFHNALSAATDNEAFALSFPTGESLITAPGTGTTAFNLGLPTIAQTSAATGVTSETGYFTSTATSDLVAPVHIGAGFLGTTIGDPLRTGAPFFAGIMLPYMTRMDPGLLGAGPVVASTGTPAVAKSTTSGDTVKKDLATFQPVIKNAVADSLAGQDARNATAAGIGANATKQTASANETAAKPTATPSPAIKPDQVFYHQQNKPFSTELTAPTGPFKMTPAKVEDMTGFDRFLMNTVARSTTDKAFVGTTSSPIYMTPSRAIAPYPPYDFLQGARGMTMPGTHLNYRAWPL